MKSKFNILFILISTLIFISCKRDEFKPYFGPQACPDSDFQILAGQDFKMANLADPRVVDFTTTDYLHCTAKFNSAAPWRIEITGVSSHATRVFEGFTSTVDVSWYGRPTGNLLFINENVTIKFSIRCREELTVTQSVNIKKGDFSKDPNVVIVSDFDSHLAPEWDYYLLDGLPAYPKASGDTAWCPYTNKSGFCSAYKASPQGGRSLSFIGTTPVTGGDQKNLFAEYDIYPPALNIPAVSTDPNNLWFNFYANSNNTPVKVNIYFRHWNGTTRFGKSSFSIKSSDWEMYSINLGQLEKGVGDALSFNAKDVGLVLITIIQSEGISPTEFNMDLATFTSGESFLGGQVQK